MDKRNKYRSNTQIGIEDLFLNILPNGLKNIILKPIASEIAKITDNIYIKYSPITESTVGIEFTVLGLIMYLQLDT